jgi:hypothetical protein
MHLHQGQPGNSTRNHEPSSSSSSSRGMHGWLVHGLHMHPSVCRRTAQQCALEPTLGIWLWLEVHIRSNRDTAKHIMVVTAVGRFMPSQHSPRET